MHIYKRSIIGMTGLTVAIVAGSTGAEASAPRDATSARSVSPLSVSLQLRQTPQQTKALAALARQRPNGKRARQLAALSPSPSSRKSVLAWAKAAHLQVVYSSPYLVEVRGTAGDLARQFSVGLREFPVDRVRRVVPTGELRVPTSLQAAVSSASGLSDMPMTFSAVPYGPGELQQISKVPAAPNPAAGAGATIGTVNLSGWYPDDLTTWSKDPNHDGNTSDAIPFSYTSDQFGYVTVGGASPYANPSTDSGGSGEVALDAESILAVAPKAKQLHYFGNNTAADYLAVLDRMAQDSASGLLTTASTSWGTCEARASQLLDSESSAIARIVAGGATFFAASGDDGAYACTGSSQLAVVSPASSPYAVAVGGLNATPSGSDFTYTAWSPSATDPSSSGGGNSDYWARPDFQPASAGAGRAVPDISGLADPRTGMSTYSTYHGGWGVTGGTSLAAPAAAAALADVVAASGKGPVGDILPRLYAHPDMFLDVTAGSNGGFAAGPGYDKVTGLGVPRWADLAAPLTAPDIAPTVRLTASVISAGQRTTVEYQGAPGATLTILSKTQPATDYSVIGTVTLDGFGSGTSSHAPTKNTRIEARTDSGRYSAQPLIQVRSVASFNASRVSTRTYTFTGRVYPARDQRLVSIYRNGTLVAQTRCDASGIYNVTRTLAAGGYSFQSRTANDVYNLGTTSRTLPVTVY